MNNSKEEYVYDKQNYSKVKIEVELYTGSKKGLVRNPSEMLDSTTCMAKYNEPNLDNGNLIPVYYDEYKEVYKREWF